MEIICFALGFVCGVLVGVLIGMLAGTMAAQKRCSSGFAEHGEMPKELREQYENLFGYDGTSREDEQ